MFADSMTSGFDDLFEAIDGLDSESPGRLGSGGDFGYNAFRSEGGQRPAKRTSLAAPRREPSMLLLTLPAWTENSALWPPGLRTPAASLTSRGGLGCRLAQS